MKRLIKIALFLTIILSLDSCGIVKLFYGMRPPKDENRKEQIAFLKSIGVDTLNLYNLKCEYIDSLNNPKYALNTYKLKTGARFSPVQVRMYDSLGNFIYGWEQCMGNALVLGIFDSVPIGCKYELPVNPNLNFYTDLNLFEIAERERIQIIANSKKYNYIIILFWAEWAGVFTKRNFRDVYEYIDRNPDYKFYLLKLNAASYCD